MTDSPLPVITLGPNSRELFQALEAFLESNIPKRDKEPEETYHTFLKTLCRHMDEVLRSPAGTRDFGAVIGVYQNLALFLDESDASMQSKEITPQQIKHLKVLPAIVGVLDSLLISDPALLPNGYQDVKGALLARLKKESAQIAAAADTASSAHPDILLNKGLTAEPANQNTCLRIVP